MKLLAEGPDGRELIACFRSAGCLLGVASVVLARPHAASAIAVCRLGAIVIRADLFLSLCAEHGKVSEFVRMQQSEDAYEQFETLCGIALLPARSRLLALLGKIVKVPRDRLQVLLPPILHQDLAAAVGITPTHLSRVLKQLEHEGVLERTASKLLIKTAAIIRSC